MNLAQYGIVAIIGVSIAGMVCMDCQAQDEEANGPSLEMISASLAEQSRGGVVRAVYTLAKESELINESPACYHRSRSAQFVTGKSGGESVWFWYDRAANESRSLFREEGVRIGIITSMDGGTAPQLADVPDPLMLEFAGGPLVERIVRGKVRNAKESVDGHDCWRVDADIDGPNGGVWTAWLDPSIAFLPRRIARSVSGVCVQTATLTGYSLRGAETWYPGHIRSGLIVDGVPHYTDIDISSVEVVGSDSLPCAPDFPSGVRVVDRILDVEYEAP